MVSAHARARTQTISCTDRKIFIGMLNKKMNENDIKTMFTKFGAIEDCMVLRDNDGKSRGERCTHSPHQCVCVCAHILVAHPHETLCPPLIIHILGRVLFCTASCPRFVTRPFDFA